MTLTLKITPWKVNFPDRQINKAIAKYSSVIYYFQKTTSRLSSILVGLSSRGFLTVRDKETWGNVSLERPIFLSLVYAAQWWAIWVIGSRLLSFSRRRTRLRCYYFFCKHGREHRFVLRHWYNVLPHCKNIKVCINNSVGRRFGARKANGKASNGSAKER